MFHVIDTLQQPTQKLQINLAPGEAEDLKSFKTALNLNRLKAMTQEYLDDISSQDSNPSLN